METKRLKRIAKVTEEQYQEVMNNGSIVVGGVVKHKDDYEFVTKDITLEQAKQYTDEQITKAIAGGAKLYVHYISIYRETADPDADDPEEWIVYDGFDFKIFSTQETPFFEPAEAIITPNDTTNDAVVKLIPLFSKMPVDYVSANNGYDGIYCNDFGSFASGIVRPYEAFIEFYGLDEINIGDTLHRNINFYEIYPSSKKERWSIYDDAYPVPKYPIEE